jgi:hypothetical protein
MYDQDLQAKFLLPVRIRLTIGESWPQSLLIPFFWSRPSSQVFLPFHIWFSSWSLDIVSTHCWWRVDPVVDGRGREPEQGAHAKVQPVLSHLIKRI